MFSVLMLVIGLLPDSNAPQSSSKSAPSTNSVSAPGGSYSAYPCDGTQAVSSIDHKPCKTTTTPQFPPAHVAASAKSAPVSEDGYTACNGNLHDEPGGVLITGSVKEGEAVQVLEQE
ncbi:MAG: hypothetical protein ACLQFM_04900, partial [Terriglobales bacterium]